MLKFRARLAACFTCLIFLSYASGIQAACAAGSAPVAASTGSTGGGGGAVNLNLSSGSRIVPAASVLGPVPVHIRVGGAFHSVSPGQSLTPSEWLAVYQVLHEGTQRLVIGANGAATGGNASIGQQLGQLVSSLAIPTGVTVIDRSAVLNVLGNLTDAGRLYAAATNPGLSTIVANNIIVSPHGLISTQLPASNLFSAAERANRLGLVLSANNDIVNGGTISSSGSLSLTAGGSITNALPEGSLGLKPTIQAAGNLNLTAGSGAITNQGLIASETGSINLLSRAPVSNLNINAAGGSFQAPAGAVNVGDASFSGSANLHIGGGDFLSKELNLYAGSGEITANLAKVTGAVNVTGGSAHIYADTQKLVLGNANVGGDPTYVNAGGDIQLVGTVMESADLAIIASGNITASGAAQIVDNGHNVWLIAGAAVDTATGSCVGCGTNAGGLTVPPGTATAISSGYVQVTAAGGSGGNIDLQTNNTLAAGNTVIDTSGATAGSAGGSVNLVAIANGGTGGKILFPTSAGVTSINTSGNGSGANGDVNAYAAAASGQAISLGGIKTNGGTGGAGNVTIKTAQAAFTGGTGCASCISFDQSGTATGSVSASSPTNGTTTFTGPIAAGAGNVSVQAGGITTQTSAPISANNVSLSTNSGSNGNIALNADVTAANSAALSADGAGTISDVPNWIASIPVGTAPQQTTVNAAGTFAYVTNFSSSSVSVINTATNSIVSTIPIAGNPIAIALNPAGTVAYVTTAGNAVFVIDTGTNSVTASIAVGSNPTAIAINPAGTLVYVANQSSNSISVIDTATNAVTATISLPISPRAVAFNPATGQAYVTGSTYLAYVINPSSNTVANSFLLPYSATGGTAFNAAGTSFYAPTQDSIYVLNTANNSSVNRIGEFSSVAVSLDPAGSQAYLVSGGNTAIYNPASNSYTIFAGAGSSKFNGPNFVAFVGNDATAYVPNSSSNVVNVIKTPSVVANQLTLSSGSGDVAVSVGGAPTVNVSTAGSVNITAHGPLSIGASTVGGTFAAGASGALSTSGDVTAGAINFSSGNGANVSIGGNLTGTNGIAVSSAGSGTVTIPNGVSLSSTNANITLTGALNLNTGSSYNAGTGTVALQPTLGTTIGVNGGAGTFSVTQALMNTISAGTLQIGSLLSGAITQAGVLDESGAAGPGVFNLSLMSNDTIDSSTSTTNMGARNLTINALGNATIGTITGGSNAGINITGANIILQNDISAGNGSTVNINLAPVSATGSLTQNAGKITASTIAFSLPYTGAAGDLTNISISAANLNIAGNVRDISINNSSGSTITLGSINTLGDLTFSSNGPIAVGNLSCLGNVNIATTNGGISMTQLKGAFIHLSAAGSGGITGSVQGNLLFVNSGSGDINLTGNVNDITVGTTGNVIINNTVATPSNPTHFASTGTTFASLFLNQLPTNLCCGTDLSVTTPLNAVGSISISAASLTVPSGSDITAGGDVTLSAQSYMTLNSKITTSNNSNITIIGGSSLTWGATVNAGTGTVEIAPNGYEDIGINSTLGPFRITLPMMASITAGTLQIGYGGVDYQHPGVGAIYTGGTIDVSGSGPAGAYNLVLISGSYYAGNLGTIILGSKSLSIMSISELTTGTIIGGNGSISLTNSRSFGIQIGASASQSITSTGPINLILSGDSGSNFITGPGAVQTTGALTVSLGLTSFPSTINTSVGSLSANGAYGDLTLNQTGNITLNGGISLPQGSLTVNSSAGKIQVGNISGDVVAANGGINLNVVGANTISGPGSLQSTGTLAVNLGSSGSSTVSTAVSALIGTSSGGSLTVNQTGNLTLTNGINYAGGALSVTATGGAITIGTVAGNSLIANGGISLTATGDIKGPGTLVSTGAVSLTSSSGNIAGNSAGTNALNITSAGSGLTLFVNAPHVGAGTGIINISDTAAESVTLLNGSTAGSDMSVASGGGIKIAGSVSANNNITLTTSAGGQITSLYPADLDLSQTTPNLTIPSNIAPLTVNSGAQLASSSGSISINGQTQGSSQLGPGTYGSSSYSVTITVGTSGSLIITPSTLVTPAEWIAAVQVESTGTQPLTIGADNAASGGSFSLTPANVPSGGFSIVSIPNNPVAVTANVSSSSIQTNLLVNNGVIQAAGAQTNVTITSAGTNSGNLEVGGSGSFVASSGKLILQAASGNGNILKLDAGTNFAITGALSLISPNIVVGSVGSAMATLTTNGGQIAIQPSSTGLGSLAFSAGGTSAVLNLNGAAVSISSTGGTTIGANFTLHAGTSLSVSDTGAGGIMTGSGGAFSSPIVVLSAVGGSIGTANSSVSVMSGGAAGLSLFATSSQVSGTGGIVNLSDASSEAVTLRNDSNALSAGVLFKLSANGNISASTAANDAIASPSISLNATGGNIGADAVAGTPLLVNSGGTSGLTLFVSATQANSNGGSVNITDGHDETLTLANGTLTDNSLTMVSGRQFIAVGSVSAGGNISLTTLGSDQITTEYPSDLDLSLTTPTLIIPSLSQTDLSIAQGGAVSTTGGAITINGQAQSASLGPGSYGAANYSITINGGPTGSLVITPTTLVTPAEWVAAIQVQSTANQPLVIGTDNSATGGSFTLAPANVPSGGFNNILLPSTQSGITMTVSTPIQTVSLTNGGIIQGSAIQIFSNGDLSIGGSGSIHSSVGTTIQSGSSNNVIFTGGILSFAGNTEVFSGTGNLNQIFLQSGAGFSGADAVTLHSNKLAGDVSNISGNPLTLLPYSGSGTIANPSGDVVLPSSLTFSGKNLAILASGDIRAKSTVTSINLSSASSSGGSLIMVAGFDFNDTSVPSTPLDPLFKAPNEDTFVITGPSPGGGSVLLPKVAINTSSGSGGNAGDITAVAHGGTNSAGTIQLGNITATANAKTGIGGSVALIGQGGVQTGFIKTTGASGNSITIEAAAPTAIAGSVKIVDGQRVGQGFTWLNPVLTDGGAIQVTGVINTSGTNGRAGDILMSANFQVEVKGTITATGLFAPNNLVSDAGGDISIQSSLSKVAITGSIDTSALARSTAVGTASGNAGSMHISAESYISTGALLARGANNLGAGSGGTGGNILLTTNLITGTGTPADGYRFGNITVNYITVQGGSVSSNLGDMNASGGNSGGVAVDAGTFVVTSSSGGISINDRPGLGRQPANNGSIGGVAINTYAIQQLPASLDLTSTVANIPSLPGGMFTVGLAAPVNGTQGSIAVDSLSSGSNNFTNKLNTGGGPIPGEILQTTPNGNSTIVISITNQSAGPIFQPIVFGNGKRGMLNPSQAVAEFQNGRGQTPITGSAGTITVDQTDVNGTTFTGFKLPAGMTLSVTGVMPVLNLPSNTLFQGTLSFATPGSVDYLNLGGGTLTVGSSGAGFSPNATIDASNSTLILSGTGSTWTNNAHLIAGTLVLARPTTSALSFVTGPGASTQASEILLGSALDTSIAITFKSNGASQWDTGGSTPQAIPVVFGSVKAPVVYQFNASANGLNTSLPQVKLTFALSENAGGVLSPITGTVSGNINASSISITGMGSSAVLSGVSRTVQTPVSIGDAASLISAGIINISTPASISIGNSNQLMATSSLSITAGGVLTVGSNNTMSAGVLSQGATPYGTGTLLKGQILTSGSIALTGSATSGNSGVIVGDSNRFNEAGSKFNVNAKSGDIQIGDTNLFLGRGSNVVVLAKGNISGGVGNQFSSQGLQNTSSGGVELGAGTTSSTILSAFSKPSGTRLGIANILGISDPSPTHGVILLNPVNATGVNMAVSGPPNMLVDLNTGGVTVFDAVGGATIHMQSGGQIQTQATKPISLFERIDGECIVDTDLDDNCMP